MVWSYFIQVVWFLYIYIYIPYIKWWWTKRCDGWKASFMNGGIPEMTGPFFWALKVSWGKIIKKFDKRFHCRFQEKIGGRVPDSAACDVWYCFSLSGSWWTCDVLWFYYFLVIFLGNWWTLFFMTGRDSNLGFNGAENWFTISRGALALPAIGQAMRWIRWWPPIFVGFMLASLTSAKKQNYEANS